MNIVLRTLLKSAFFLCALIAVAATLLADMPYALLAIGMSMLVGLCIITFYHRLHPDFQRSSTSQNRKLTLLFLITFVGFFITSIGNPIDEPVAVICAWVWLSLISFFFTDTFRSVLTYFGKHKPIVKDVRSYYHLSLFLLHFAIGASIIALSQLLGESLWPHLIDGSAIVAAVFGFLAIILLVAFAFSWHVYRVAHAEGERFAINAFGEDFTKQYKDGLYSALPEKEF